MATYIQGVNIDEITGVGGERKIWGAVNLKFPDVPKRSLHTPRLSRRLPSHSF
eukprot:COSAG02_NODE_1597_length_11762_cov_4.644002_3_plen_53_part_00